MGSLKDSGVVFLDGEARLGMISGKHRVSIMSLRAGKLYLTSRRIIFCSSGYFPEVSEYAILDIISSSININGLTFSTAGVKFHFVYSVFDMNKEAYTSFLNKFKNARQKLIEESAQQRVAESQSINVSSSHNIADQLERINKLFLENAIDESEYKKLKDKIINS